MTTERLVLNRNKIAHETVDGEVIIINLENGTYYSLVDSAAVVWTLLEQGPSLEQLLDALAQQYNAPRADIAAAVNPFVEDLRREDLIVLATEAPLPQLATTPTAASTFAAPTLARYTNMSDLLLLDPIHDVDEQGWPVVRAP